MKTKNLKVLDFLKVLKLLKVLASHGFKLLKVLASQGFQDFLHPTTFQKCYFHVGPS